MFFTATGNFKLVCLVHENMTGVVHVLPPDAPLPHDQQFYDAQADRERKAYLASDPKVHQHGPQHSQSVIAGTGAITATPGGSSTLSVVRFIDDDIVVHTSAPSTTNWA